MALSFSTTAAFSAANGVKAVIYGPSGAGKTMLAATADDPLVISAEKGLLCLSPSNVERVFGKASVDIPVVEIETGKDLDAVYKLVTTDPNFQQKDIFIDSVSEIAEKILTGLKKINSDPRKAYGQMGDVMIEHIRRFRDLPDRNVFFLAKRDRNKDEATGTMLYQPSMPGQFLTMQLPHFFDIVLSYEVAEDKGQTYRFLRTALSAQFFAKDRSGALDETEYPDISNIVSKIKNQHHE